MLVIHAAGIIRAHIQLVHSGPSVPLADIDFNHVFKVPVRVIAVGVSQSCFIRANGLLDGCNHRTPFLLPLFSARPIIVAYSPRKCTMHAITRGNTCVYVPVDLVPRAALLFISADIPPRSTLSWVRVDPFASSSSIVSTCLPSHTGGHRQSSGLSQHPPIWVFPTHTSPQGLKHPSSNTLLTLRRTRLHPTLRTSLETHLMTLQRPFRAECRVYEQSLPLGRNTPSGACLFCKCLHTKEPRMHPRRCC